MSPNTFSDSVSEEAMLAAFYQDVVHVINPEWYTDTRRDIAEIIQPKPKSKAEMRKRLKAHNLDTLDTSWLYATVKATPEQLASTADTLVEYMVRRVIVDASTAMSHVARDMQKDTGLLIGDVSRIYDDVAQAAQDQEGDNATVQTGEWFKGHLDGKEVYGWEQLWAPTMNRVLGPLDQVLMVIAGLPGSGKTMAQMAMGLDYATQGAKWMFSSPDMGTKDLWLRLVSMYSGIPYRRLRRHSKANPILVPLEKDMARSANEELLGMSIRIDNTANTTQLIARARAWGADVLMGDYLDLFRMPELAGQGEYAQIRGSVFAFADEARNRLVVLAAQVNADDPNIYGTAWGKDVANRAGIVSWIKRLRAENISLWMLLKNRNDQTGSVPFTVLTHCMRMLELPVMPVDYKATTTLF